MLALSAKIRSPLPSIVMPCGSLIIAEVAAAPSPEYPAVPVPAIVVTMPVEASTSRIRALPASAM